VYTHFFECISINRKLKFNLFLLLNKNYFPHYWIHSLNFGILFLEMAVHDDYPFNGNNGQKVERKEDGKE
jgi:hypothetical protein